MKVWRVLLVALGFGEFGVMCMVGNFIFLSLWLSGASKTEKGRNIARDVVFFTWRFFAKTLVFVGYMKLFVKQKAFAPKTLLIANHPSLLDVVFFLGNFRRINCVVKSNLARNPFLFAAIKACGYILNDEQILQKCQEAFERGESVVVFPEGTRTKERVVFHKAAFYVAVNFAEFLHCYHIKTSGKTLRKDEAWWKTTSEVVAYEVAFLHEVKLAEFMPGEANTKRVRGLFAEMSELYAANGVRKKENGIS